jgi:hypothetical protein
MLENEKTEATLPVAETPTVETPTAILTPLPKIETPKKAKAKIKKTAEKVKAEKPAFDSTAYLEKEKKLIGKVYIPNRDYNKLTPKLRDLFDITVSLIRDLRKKEKTAQVSFDLPTFIHHIEKHSGISIGAIKNSGPAGWAILDHNGMGALCRRIILNTDSDARRVKKSGIIEGKESERWVKFPFRIALKDKRISMTSGQYYSTE